MFSLSYIYQHSCCMPEGVMTVRYSICPIFALGHVRVPKSSSCNSFTFIQSVKMVSFLSLSFHTFLSLPILSVIFLHFTCPKVEEYSPLGFSYYIGFGVQISMASEEIGLLAQHSSTSPYTCDKLRK